MKKEIITFLSISVIIYGCSTRNPVAVIDTGAGEIEVTLFIDKAPVTVSNFLHYVDNHLYDNTCFYRVVRMDNQPSDSIRIEVIQGGRYNEEEDMFEPVRHETTAETGIRHLDGTISMARNEPGSATSEFFITVGDQPELDYGGMRNRDGQGFAAFGRVTKGMNVVRKIHAARADGQYLSDTIPIKRIYCR